MTYILTYFNDCMTFYGIFPCILLLGGYLTWRLRFIQITSMAEGFRALFRHKQTSLGGISPYAAVSAVLAGNLGTGNISGMPVQAWRLSYNRALRFLVPERLALLLLSRPFL